MIDEHEENGQVFSSAPAFLRRHFGQARLCWMLALFFPVAGYLVQRLVGIGLFVGIVASAAAFAAAIARRIRCRYLSSLRLVADEGRIVLYASGVPVSVAEPGTEPEQGIFVLSAGRFCRGVAFQALSGKDTRPFVVLDCSTLTRDGSGVVCCLPGYWIVLDGEDYVSFIGLGLSGGVSGGLG